MKLNKFTEEELLNVAKNAYEKGEATFEIKSENCSAKIICELVGS
jgi:hypothetical protein